MLKKILENNEQIKSNTRTLNILKEYFPDCFTKDEEFDIERFKNKIASDVNTVEDGYELNFLGKNYANLIVSQETTTVIEPDIEHNQKEENKNSNNIYISGDNLDAIKHLLNSYSKKIKCIYIDPPYNTNNDEFVYNDSFNFSKEELINKLDISEEKAEKLMSFLSRKSSSHSAWLTFMYPRLLLARDLLTDDGVIFISIDDNEQANLKLLCDTIFGEENFYGQIVHDKCNTQNDANEIQKNVDYILCYVKKKENNLVTYESIVNKNIYQNNWYEYNFENSSYIMNTDNKKFYIDGENGATGNSNKLVDRIHLGYTVYYLKNKIENITENIIKIINQNLECSVFIDDNNNIHHIIVLNDYDKEKVTVNSTEEDVYNDMLELLDIGYKKIRPPMRKGNKLGRWTWSIANIQDKWNNNCLYITEDYKIKEKVYINNDIKIFNKKQQEYIKVAKRLPIKNLLENYPSKYGSDTLAELFREHHTLFNNPKNHEMIKYLIDSLNLNEFIILDFFSGSATTAQAVIELNIEKNKNIQYILVQINEQTKDDSEVKQAGYKTISQLGIERIRRIQIKHGQNVYKYTGFKHFILKEMNDNILDKIKEFDSNNNNVNIENNLEEEFGIDTILTTWINQDGYGLTANYSKINLGEYEAYYVYNESLGGNLYLINQNIDETFIEKLIDKIKNDDKFNIKLIVIFGYNFTYSEMQMIEKNISQLKNSGLNLDIAIDKRY